MMIKDIQRLITDDKDRELEVMQSTGDMKVRMHSAFAFLNTRQQQVNNEGILPFRP